MGFVKISDPNILDLTTIHNIINTVNQHSDTLNTLTNNFGALNYGSTTYTDSDTSHLFDFGSQMVVYGRASFTSSDTSKSSGTSKIYYKTVTFSGSSAPSSIPAFSSSAYFLFLSPDIRTTAADVGTSYLDFKTNVYALTTTSFKIRLILPSAGIASGNTLFVNWFALGPKGK